MSFCEYDFLSFLYSPYTFVYFLNIVFYFIVLSIRFSGFYNTCYACDGKDNWILVCDRLRGCGYLCRLERREYCGKSKDRRELTEEEIRVCICYLIDDRNQ